MYFAPSVGTIHPQLVMPELSEPLLPIMAPPADVEFGSPPTTTTPSPPSGPDSNSVILSANSTDFSLSSTTSNTNTTSYRSSKSRWSILRCIFGIYHWLVDLLLLVVVCFMGCFFYDVEVKVVKSDRRQASARGRSGRVVIRTEEFRLPTTITTSSRTTRTTTSPPRSGRSTRSGRNTPISSSSLSPSNDNWWNAIS